MMLSIAQGLNNAHAISEVSDQTAQSDLSLRWSHKSYCGFCHALAHFSFFSTKSFVVVLIRSASQRAEYINKSM